MFVGGSWERSADLDDLIYTEMYRDFGVARDEAWRETGEDSVVAVALAEEDGALLGTARLVRNAGDSAPQVRQVVVAPDARVAGVGRELMDALEREAARTGAEHVRLNARDTAVAFYRRLGYEADGEWFTSELTGIEHLPMRKRL